MDWIVQMPAIANKITVYIYEQQGNFWLFKPTPDEAMHQILIICFNTEHQRCKAFYFNGLWHPGPSDSTKPQSDSHFQLVSIKLLKEWFSAVFSLMELW